MSYLSVDILPDFSTCLQVLNPDWEDHWDNRKLRIPRFFKGKIMERNLKRSYPYKVRWTELRLRADAEDTAEGNCNGGRMLLWHHTIQVACIALTYVGGGGGGKQKFFPSASF